MPEQLWFTQVLNHLLAGPVTTSLRMLHIEPKYPAAPISNSFSMEVLVFAFLLIVFLLVRSRLSVDSPGGLQHSFESIEGFVLSQSHEIIGHHSEPYTPFFAIVFIFILVCNLIGLIPGFESPTGVPIVPLGCAIVAFIYYHTQGFKHAGLKYLLHFFGPPMEGMPLIARILLALLMLPIELVSHFARSALADGSSLGQHFRRRPDHAGFLFDDPDRHPDHLQRPAHRGRRPASVRVHAAVDHLRVGRGCRRALEQKSTRLKEHSD